MFGQIVGDSTPFKKVLDTAEKIAKIKSLTTLIVGESGTGKEEIARLIHKLSHASTQPFVDINCGGLPENLLESELFGHEKGAFTGAEHRKKGLFELAHGGTIFLDEIGNTSPAFQVKLLKAVENKRFRRLNGTDEIEVSARVVAATNLRLDHAVRRGEFREDLYYRLNVCPVYIPPLRERGADVIKLAHFFLRRFNKDYRLKVRGFTTAANQFLLACPWPGNVRQLKNVLERAMLVECDEWVDVKHLRVNSSDVTLPAPALKRAIANPLDQVQGLAGEGASLAEAEQKAIKSALVEAKGNVSAAARILRINRGKLRYRMDKLGIPAFQAYL